MANYLVRIELHGATWHDYEGLHVEMARSGFSRDITSDDGQSYQLPTAQYVIRTAAELEAIRGLATTAARTTGRKFGVIVAEYSKSAWAGLSYA